MRQKVSLEQLKFSPKGKEKQNILTGTLMPPIAESSYTFFYWISIAAEGPIFSIWNLKKRTFYLCHLKICKLFLPSKENMD